MKVASLSPLWQDDLATLLCDGVEFVTVDPQNPEAHASDLAAAHVLITPAFDERLASLCRSLELLLCPAAGTEGIDRKALPPGVTLRNGVGHEIPMAEYAIGALVGLRQRFLEADTGLRAGEWRFGYFGRGGFVEELWGSTLGIVGFGRIGVEVARRAAPFGMRCRSVTLHPEKPIEPGLLPLGIGALDEPSAVDRLFQESDAVVLACEYSALTRGLVDSRRLAMMRPRAVLVNIARGPIVEERALYEALAQGRIAGAAIDVWYCYPDGRDKIAAPSTYPFATLKNVLMTPHCSGWTEAGKRRKLAFLAACVNEWYESRQPAQ